MSEDNASQTAVKKDKFEGKKVIQIAFIVLAVIIVGMALSLVSGLVYVGLKKPSQVVVVQTPICSSDSSIKKLNGYLEDVTNGDQSKTGEAIQYIKSQSNYSSDPTCVEALARFYFVDRDIRGLDEQIDRLEELADKGLYPSNRFDGLTSITNNAVNYENLAGRAR